MTILGWSKIEKIRFFFFVVKMGFYMVWWWFGVFLNGFWTFLVDFEVTLVSDWSKMRLGRRQVVHFSQVVDYGFFGQSLTKVTSKSTRNVQNPFKKTPNHHQTI
jgi:hypothetical protein